MASLTIFTTYIISLTLIFFSCNHSLAHKMIIHHDQHPKLKHFMRFKEETHGKGSLNAIKRSYVASIEIGRQQVFLVFDTGSRFTWVQAKNCLECLPSRPPIIAPYKATRDFVIEKCNPNIGNIDYCRYSKDTPRPLCQGNTCTYLVQYQDGSDSSGLVATEIFKPFIDKSISQRMVFGYGTKNNCFAEGFSCFQGVAGFGYGPLALPSQLTPQPTRWGFCLPYNESMDGSFMVGDEAQIFGDYGTTPLIIDHNNRYLTNLTAIYVIGPGGAVINPDAASTILIDTGATLSYLEDSIFDNLLNKVKHFVKETFDDIPVIDPTLSDLNLELCYRQPYQVEIVIVLGEAYLRIEDPQKVWWKLSIGYTYCLSFKRNGGEFHNIIGNYHIRGHKVVYNLNTDNPTIQVSAGQDETGCFTPART